ncbi:MAG: mechanosensitive ion channel family protein [Verrucomicrobia bacterium]|nr:mechanosensitive ion channel family protein [Verrucomicrobiota bacterium]
MISFLIAAATGTTSLSPKPWWTEPGFGLNRIEALTTQIAGRPLWQYAATVLWIVLAFMLAILADYVMTRWVKRITAKTETDIDDKLLDISHRPLKVVVLLVVLKAGLKVFDWPALLAKGLDILFAVGMAIAAVYVAFRLVDFFVAWLETKFFSGDAQLARMMLPIMSRTLKGFVVISGALTVAQYLNIPVTSVIAGLGVGGIAVALAAQNTLANVFGSITILTDRPFRVGDRVQIDKYDGVVETIGLRSTRLRTLEGHLVVLPNKTVADSGINNISMRPNIRETFSLSLTYNTPAEKVQEAVNILKEIFAAHPMTHDVIVFWKTYAAASLDIFIVYWCRTTDYRLFTRSLEEINLEIKRRFDAAGLEFAFPTQTIHLRQEKA